MQLIETKKVFIQHQIALGVPPTINNLKCIGVGKNGRPWCFWILSVPMTSII